MRLRHFINEQSDYIFYVDLDGVLVDFLEGARTATDLPIRSHSDWEKVKEDQWVMIADLGSDFWADLPWTNDGKQLWAYLKQFKPNILSAYPQAHQNKRFAIKGKNEWIRKNITGYKDILLVKGQDKQKYATPNSILIDDSERNIRQWQSRGGIGILHKRAAETIRTIENYVKGLL